MANMVMGAMPSIIPKLYQLLKEEYNLQAGVKEHISSLTQELELAQAALCKVAEVPWDQLDKQVQIWARKVREASYDMEDVLDTFLVRVEGPDSTEEKSLRKHLKKMTNFFKRSKARRKISGDVKNIMTHLQEVTEQCRRYKVEDIGTSTTTTSTVDPRLHAMYTQVNKLVGMDKSSGELMSKLQLHDTKMNKVSIVGAGGLGKTTLAKVVYDKIKGDFSCTAFVAVGRNPDLKKIFKDILIDLDRQKYLYISTAELDEKQFIDELHNFLGNEKRFLIVIDDIWETESWETIKLAINGDKNCGDRIIITTRNMEVAAKANEVYKLQPLPYDSSRELLNARINGHQGRQVDSELDETSDKFIRKCGGIPLAIITMASLLAGKPRDKWSELYDSIDFASKDDKEAEKTMRILSFSYYDMPSHLRTCLLYLSASMEDSIIDKVSLLWKWVAEGFVLQEKGISLFETGERYFIDLINRSMIQAVEFDDDDNIIIGCHVHDMVLDFIRSMCQDENFFTVVDTNNQDTQPQSNVRRLANHSITIGQTHETNSHLEMPKLRSFIALRCAIDTCAPPLSSFTLLRVLAIEGCVPRDRRGLRVEHIVHLLHLRFLSLRGTQIDKIPEDIGALRFLQTLDLRGSHIPYGRPIEWPSSCSLLKQLLCLRISFDRRDVHDVKVFSLEGMTSLEELVIATKFITKPKWRILKELASLTEIRVLELEINLMHEEEYTRDLAESLRHLHKLQSLNLRHDYSDFSHHVLPGTDMTELSFQLRHFSSSNIKFSKLPSCINPRRLLNLTHLNMTLKHLDEEDLKTLGRLPELHYLSLNLGFLSRPATIPNISDSDVCYFPMLRSLKLKQSMISFVANKEDKRVSFHIWKGYRNYSFAFPSVSNDELERAGPSVSDDELKRDDEMQCPMPSVSHDDEFQRPLKRSKLHQGLAAVAYYLVAFCLHVLAYVKIWTHKQMDQHPLPSVSDDENKGSTISSAGAAAAPRFMPSLQLLDFSVHFSHGIPNWIYNLGWEHLSSLREIHAYLYGESKDKLENMLRRAAQDHPNHPTLHIG